MRPARPRSAFWKAKKMNKEKERLLRPKLPRPLLLLRPPRLQPRTLHRPDWAARPARLAVDEAINRNLGFRCFPRYLRRFWQIFRIRTSGDQSLTSGGDRLKSCLNRIQNGGNRLGVARFEGEPPLRDAETGSQAVF